MTRLSWSDTSKRSLETGLDRGVLYPKGTPPAGSIVAKNLIPNPRAARTVNDVVTNLITNPDFATNVLNYTADVTLTRSTAWSARAGGASMQMAPAGGNPDSYSSPISDAGLVMTGLVPGRVYTASGTVQTPAAQTGTLSPRARRIAAFTKVGAAAYVENLSPAGPVTGVGRVSVTFMVPVGATEAFVRYYNGSGVATEIVRWSDLMITEGPHLHPYFDGSVTDNVWTYAWSGTAHASTSSRTGSLEFLRNLVSNPQTFEASRNDVQWGRTLGAPITGHPLGFTSAVEFWRDPAVNPTAGPEFIASLYNVDGLGPTDLFRYYGVWVQSNVRAQIDLAPSSPGAVSIIAEPNVWYWLKTTAPHSGWSGLSSRRLNPDNSFANAQATDRFRVAGTTSSEVNFTSYFDGSSSPDNGLSFRWLGATNNSLSVGISSSVEGCSQFNYQKIVQGPLLASGAHAIDLRPSESIGNSYVTGTTGSAYFGTDPAYAATSGEYYAGRVTIQRIPASVFDNAAVLDLRIHDNTDYLTDHKYVTAAEIPADGSPVTFDLPAFQAVGAGLYPRFYAYIYTGLASVRITEVRVDKVASLGATLSYDYFDGASDDGVIQPMHTYAWHGTPDASYSTMQINNSLAVPWIGLTGVDENGAESAAAYYVDGRPFLFLPKPKEYQATLRAFTYPDEFAQIIGIKEATAGMFLDSQQGDAFDLCYRTLVADNLNGTDAGYKIHLVYNATVAPQGLSYASLGGSINPTDLAWEIQAVPMAVPGYRATAHVIIDTRHMDPAQLAEIEALLYGSDTKVPGLPAPQEIFDLLSFGDTIVITDNGDGTWDAVGSYHNIYLIGDGVFEIDNVIAVDHGDGTYDISSTP